MVYLQRPERLSLSPLLSPTNSISPLTLWPPLSHLNSLLLCIYNSSRFLEIV